MRQSFRSDPVRLPPEEAQRQKLRAFLREAIAPTVAGRAWRLMPARRGPPRHQDHESTLRRNPLTASKRSIQSGTRGELRGSIACGLGLR